MITSGVLLEELRDAYGNCSDYRLAKLLEISQQAVSRYINKGLIMSDEPAAKAAQLLGYDEKYILTCLHAERAKDTSVYSHWLAIVAMLEEQTVKKIAPNRFTQARAA